MRKSCGAFTLLELLVTLTIVVLLLALLIPALASSKGRANIAGCAANLHALGQALLAYESNENSLPYVGTMPAPFQSPMATPPYMFLHAPLSGYIEPTSKAYHCPSDKTQVFDLCAAASPNHYGTSYLYWGNVLRRATTQAGAVGVEKDALNPLMWDFQGGGGPYGRNLVSPLFHPKPGSPTDPGFNTVYTDGSVAFAYGRGPHGLVYVSHVQNGSSAATAARRSLGARGTRCVTTPLNGEMVEALGGEIDGERGVGVARPSAASPLQWGFVLDTIGAGRHAESFSEYVD